MIKLLLSLSVFINLFALDANSTKEIKYLENDSLFHAQRESGLSVYEAINRALKLNDKLNASYQVVIQDKQKVEEVEAGHLPVVNLSGDLGQETRTFKADDTNPESGATAPILQTYSYKKTDLYFTITENIWNGGSIENSIDEKDASLKASMYDYRDKLEDIVVDVTTTYFEVVYSEIALKIALKNMLHYEKILNIVTIKEKNGAATKGDVNFILANVDNAKTELVQRKKTLSDALAQYVYLLQTQEVNDLPFEITTDFYKADLNTSLTNADLQNAKILKQKSYIKATKYGFLATQGNFAPKVDFSINSETRNEFDVGIGQREKINALLTFNYNLYNGGKDEATAIRLLAKMKEQKYLYKDLKRSLVFEITVLNQSVSSLAESLSLTHNEVIAARKVVKSYWLSFQNGTQDLQALQLAQRNLNRAEQDYALYKKDLIINNFELMRKTGDLLPRLSLSYKKKAEQFEAEELNLYRDYDLLK